MRSELVTQIAGEILGCRTAGIVRAGIDGVDGAGKTTFADELASAAGPLSARQVIRASVDDFHQPQALRHRRGRDSPDGFYLDSYDYGALFELLLDPLAPGGSRRFRRRVFDHHEDRPVSAAEERAAPDAVLVLDGIFLHRPELRSVWDYSVFLDVPFAVSVPRGAWGSRDPDAASNRRYVVGQQRYLDACDPRASATRVIDNTDVEAPVLVR